VWPISQALFFTAVILTRPVVAVLTLRRRKPRSTALGSSQSDLAYLFSTAVSVFVELLDYFFSPPIYFLCFYCLGDGFWAERVGLPECFLYCLHLFPKSLAWSYFSQPWKHVGLDLASSECHGSNGTLSTSTPSIQGHPSLQDVERLVLTATVFTTADPSLFARLLLQKKNIKYLFICFF